VKSKGTKTQLQALLVGSGASRWFQSTNKMRHPISGS